MKPRIIDTFPFNTEFDMLDIRLELTKDFVDRWVVVESDRTFSLQPKPYYLSEQIDRYQRWGDRLQVIQLQIPDSWTEWDVENGQRAALAQGYQDCSEDDVIMHSDLDEILNPELFNEILSCLEEKDQPVTCFLDMFIYRLDQRVDRKWSGNVVAKKRHFQDPCTLYKGPGAGVGTPRKKKDRSACVQFPETAGWHWGWMGDDALIKNKVRSCIETSHRDADDMLAKFQANQSGLAINHKCQTVRVDYQYPDSVMAVLKKYPWWS